MRPQQANEIIAQGLKITCLNEMHPFKCSPKWLQIVLRSPYAVYHIAKAIKIGR